MLLCHPHRNTKSRARPPWRAASAAALWRLASGGLTMDSRQHQSEHCYKSYVKMTKMLALDVNSTYTVEQIKSKIGAIEGINNSQQQAFFFGGNHLENDNRIADYDILTNSCVDLYVTDGMQISVSIPSAGKAFKLNVTKYQSVADVKAVIEQKGGIPPDEQILMCAGRQLEDHRMLSQCGLSNGQSLHVLVCPTGNLRVLVDTGGGRTINLDVKSWYTVADVKLLIETLEGSPACTRILSTEIGGDIIVLKDTDTLHSQHVKNNDILTLHVDRTVQFFVRTLEGKTLAMMLEISDTTKDVMKKIEEKLLVKPGIYYLRYRGRALSLGDTLLKSKVERDTTIHVCLIGQVKEKQKEVVGC